jgi:hypothetical protein
VTGLQVAPSLVLCIGLVLFLALCIVELIVLAQVRVSVCVRARACVGVWLRCASTLIAARTAAAQQYVKCAATHQ